MKVQFIWNCTFFEEYDTRKKERVTLNTRMNPRIFTDDFLGDIGTS